MAIQSTLSDLTDAGLDAQRALYFRAANYLAAAQVYLQDNVLLEEPLRPEHIRPRLLGHWGTCPGINLAYLHLNELIVREDADVLLLTGPGHGAAANLANMYLEGSLAEFYPQFNHTRRGLFEFVRSFSRPGGFPSHLTPLLPGVIHEGGELGYALPTAFGAVLDHPGLIAACIVGDGEAETGPTAAAWHGAKFLDPANDGAVLPILHLNGFKIANPTIYGTMSNEELQTLFRGYGYSVRIIESLGRIHDQFAIDLDWAYQTIRGIQNAARHRKPPVRPQWPMLILKTPKGWTGPKRVDGHAMEGSFRSHQVPCKEARTNPLHLKILEEWLRSYRPEELFNEDGAPQIEITTQCPQGRWRMALNPAAFGGDVRRPLHLPSIACHSVTDVASPGLDISPPAVEVCPRDNNSRHGVLKPDVPVSSAERLGDYLAEVTRLNNDNRNFRIVCPDELESNKLGAVLQETTRQYDWPLPENAEGIGTNGRVLEMLSEHMCQGWLQGYLLTGRHGLFPCYEAFIPIIDGMMNQYAKFLKTSKEVAWRKPISSLNYFLTSTAWRQEHNGYSHQGPGFIDNLLTKKGTTYRIYLPPDANTLLCTFEHCLSSTGYINLVIAGKSPAPQWLSLAEAREHCRIGASIWRWASTNDGADPQVVLAGCGDTVHVEVMAAAQLLRELAPHWRVRVVNVTDLQVLGIPQKYPHGLTEPRFQRLFPLDVPVVFNFHGYTAAIKQLCWERPNSGRFDLNGYREEGTTTTPFDMLVRNRCSRFQLVIQAAEKIAAGDPREAALAEEVVRAAERRLREHACYIVNEGTDPESITNWQWNLK